MTSSSGQEPGVIILFGSGETSDSGRKVYDWLFRRLAPPVEVAVLETPAGFEPNSDRVAGRVADFIRLRLQNYQPQVRVVPARHRATDYSPDNPAVIEPLLPADVIFLGPGSPTYAVRQLQDSLAWLTLLARHRAGAHLVLASAASIAAGAFALPVYEIYKVGEDLHWCWGLDLLGAYGLSLAIIPHWNNTDGGAELDTGRCFMGQARFERLLSYLPPQVTVVGLDEHTALALDLEQGLCRVIGRDGVTVLAGPERRYFEAEQTFPVTVLGPFRWPDPAAEPFLAGIQYQQPESRPQPGPEVERLVTEREEARRRHNWSQADALRDRIAALGWQVLDSPAGPQLERKP